MPILVISTQVTKVSQSQSVHSMQELVFIVVVATETAIIIAVAVAVAVSVNIVRRRQLGVASSRIFQHLKGHRHALALLVVVADALSTSYSRRHGCGCLIVVVVNLLNFVTLLNWLGCISPLISPNKKY